MPENLFLPVSAAEGEIARLVRSRVDSVQEGRDLLDFRFDSAGNEREEGGKDDKRN